MKRIALAVVLAAIAGGAWWLASSRLAGPDLSSGLLRDYNLLLVTIDTLRADRLGAYGSTAGLTPTLDRLANEGLRFQAARAHVPLTLPSHASLMTGQIPPRHGVRDNGTYRLDETQHTLAVALKSAGYETAAFVGAFVLDGRFGLSRGFDEYDDRYGQRSASPAGEVIERSAEQVAAPATEWIQKRSGRWFAWVHVYDPHEPYASPEPFASRYATTPYDGEVAHVDAVLGRMFDTLSQSGKLDRTVVVVTSDHGEGLGEHGERTHGLFAYESTLHVPLIVWCRDRIRPSVDADPIGLKDVAPLVADLLGTTMGPETQRRDRVVYFESLNANLTRNWAPLTGIIDGHLKLIDLPIRELYDLESDPGESQNLYARRPDEARRLEQALQAIGPNAVSIARGSVDSSTAARLRSLGYVVSQAQPTTRRFTADDDPKRLVGLDAAMDAAMTTAARGDHAAAIASLEDVIRKRPDLTVAHDRLAFVLRSAGRPDEAIAVLEAAASKGTADPSLLLSLGTLLQETGRLDQSASVLEATVKLNPNDLEAASRLGATYARMGRTADAERTFRSVLAVDPQSAEALANLGVLYLTAGKRDEAVATLRQAIAADPGLTGARNTLAVAYARSGDLALAVQEWQQILVLRPNDPDVLFNAGRALLQLGRRNEAIPLLERFTATAPPRYAEDVAEVRQLLRSSR